MTHSPRHWILLPHPSSERWPYYKVDQECIRALAARPCESCGKSIDFCHAFYSWDRIDEANKVIAFHNIVEHVGCYDERLENERKRLSNPWSIEIAAKAAGLSIEEFKNLPSWERNRRINELEVRA